MMQLIIHHSLLRFAGKQLLNCYCNFKIAVYPSIVLLGVCVEREMNRWNMHSLTEYCEMGSLHGLILDTDKPLPWARRASLALEIARGMNYLHSSNYMHRDLTATVCHTSLFKPL